MPWKPVSPQSSRGSLSDCYFYKASVPMAFKLPSTMMPQVPYLFVKTK